jgi:hypothetical protein
MPVASPSSPSWARARASAQEITGRSSRPPVADDDLTQRVDLRHYDDTTRVSAESDDAEPTSLINMNAHEGRTTVEPLRGMNPDGSAPQGLMDLSATSVATSIDMEWDEDDEPQTNMRD